LTNLSSVSPDDVKLADLSNNSLERKNVTFRAVKRYSDPLLDIAGDQDPKPPRSTLLI